MLYYLHIPKTGGVSVTSLFQRAADQHKKYLLNGVIVDDWTKDMVSNIGNYDYICGHVGILPLDNPSCRYVVTVRDPVKHLLSWHAHIVRATDHYLHSRIVNNDIDFEKWIMHDDFQGLVRNPQAKYLAFRPEFSISQSRASQYPDKQIAWELAYWYSSEEELEKFAINTLLGAELIGITENLIRFQKRLCQILDIKFTDHIKLNARTNADYSVSSEIETFIRSKICRVDQKIYEISRKHQESVD